MNDRFLWGFIAGFLADIVKVILNLVNVHLMHMAKLRYLDFAGILLMAHKPELLGEEILAQIAEFFWASLVGAAFAFLILRSPKNILFKSTVYGISIWFSVYAITTLYKIPYLLEIDWITTSSNLITSSIYGFLLGLIILWFEKKYCPQKR